jgi:hypothetical protein
MLTVTMAAEAVKKSSMDTGIIFKFIYIEVC